MLTFDAYHAPNVSVMLFFYLLLFCRHEARTIFIYICKIQIRECPFKRYGGKKKDLFVE